MFQSFTKFKKEQSPKLRAKFTLAYTWTSVLTVLVIEVIFIGMALVILNNNIAGSVLSDLKQKAALAAPFFSQGSPDREELGSWLQIIQNSTFTPEAMRPNLLFLSVVDQEGNLLVNTSPEPDNQTLPGSSSLNEAGLRAVLNDPKGVTFWNGQDSDGTQVAIAPVIDKTGEVRGALVSKIRPPVILEIVLRFLVLILASMAIVTAIAALVGLVFGYRTAGGLTRRLTGLSVAADHWSEGDFSTLIKDPSRDELGQVARQLNRMAEQLQNLLATRENLATLEERNRLARDLHDSVKQQIFAVGMQLGATRYLLKSEPDAAEARLSEAQRLVSQAQEELTSLILELRPVALEGMGLVAVLQELSRSWTGQTGIEVGLQVEGSQTPTPVVEEAFYRIAQEALSNIARHSQASQVKIILESGAEEYALLISDNGQGFSLYPKENSSGVGLLSMEERMKALGGMMRIESSTDKGTVIEARCPRPGVLQGVLEATDNKKNAKSEKTVTVEKIKNQQV